MSTSTRQPRRGPARPDGVRTYLPALDGLRALAVIAVVFFHAGVPSFGGGWLGVDLFIVLSGWLITAGLIGEIEGHTRLSYRDFVARRIRRLAPGAIVMLGGVGLLAIADLVRLSPGAVIAAATWTSNWYLLRAGNGYWAELDGPGPLDHLWSLAVEEQFYVVWPLVILILVGVRRHSGVAHRVRTVRVAAAAGAAGAGALGLWGAARGWDVDRLYLGTDTRSVGFLLGAACAGLRPIRGTRVHAVVTVAGPLCAVVLVGAVLLFDASSSMFAGPLQALDIACLVVVVWGAGVHRGVLVARPLVAIGRWSYGIYLWHWPLMLALGDDVMTPWLTGLVVLLVSTAVAAASYHLVEHPLRRRRTGSRVGRRQTLRAAFVLPACGVAVMVALGPTVPAPADRLTLDTMAEGIATAREIGRRVAAEPTRITVAADDVNGSGPPQAATERRPTCRSIVHLGDSNLAVAGPLFEAAYEDAGIDAVVDAAAGRTAYRSHDSESGGTLAAIETLRMSTRGPRCWVLHVGTQDAADDGAGGADRGTAIDAVIDALDGEPAIWLNTVMRGGAPFTAGASDAFNEDLVGRLARVENLSLFDWASIAGARDDEFQPDGVHYSIDLYMTLVRVVMAEIVTRWDIDRQASPAR